MNFKENLPLFLAAAALALAVVQEFYPIGFRVHPMLMLLVAALLVLRWLIRRQARKRASLLDKVPEHPLGIGDDSPGE